MEKYLLPVRISLLENIILKSKENNDSYIILLDSITKAFKEDEGRASDEDKQPYLESLEEHRARVLSLCKE